MHSWPGAKGWRASALGFQGSRCSGRITGAQEEWTTVYRFGTAEHLEAWLTSSRRARTPPRERHTSGDSPALPDSTSVIRQLDYIRRLGMHSRHQTRQRHRSPSGWGCIRPSLLLTCRQTPLHMPFWLAMLVGNPHPAS